MASRQWPDCWRAARTPRGNYLAASDASTNSGDINPASERPCASCTARESFTISSAVFVQGGSAASEMPSGVTRSPHFTISEQ